MENEVMEEIREERKDRIVALMAREDYVPMKEREIAALMQVSREQRPEFSALLGELLAEGRVQVNRRGRYHQPDEDMLVGTFIGNSRGFGFVEVEGRDEDLYIPEGEVNGAFHKDTVQVILLPGSKVPGGKVPGGKGKRQEARVTRVLKRGIEQLVGTFEKSQGFGFVVADDSRLPGDIYIPAGEEKLAEDGHKVVVKLTSYGGEGKRPEGVVEEVLGCPTDPGVDILAIVRSHGIPEEFPAEVLDRAEKIPCKVEREEIQGRLDLRQLQMVTIDGEDAKDLDDAVSVSMEGEDYLLGVHIADVSRYVEENSPLDQEAWKRGTSVYLADRVIPMLPRRLSNGICSLNQGEDRLALSCLMRIDKQGEMLDYNIAETVIRLDRRMSYTQVSGILEGDEEERAAAGELLPMLLRMDELAVVLRKKRRKRGSIDFDFPETKVILDEEGKPLEIKPYERNSATKLIEDFMLIANETVAEHFYWMDAPFLYRTHLKPDPDKIKTLALFIRNFGHSLKLSGGENIHPKEIQRLLARIEDKPEEALISRLVLRSMKRAGYSVECTGHFGLACPYYCHFTSPIRRYPDLQIHRIIKEQLRGRLDEKRNVHYRQILPGTAVQCSQTERRADEAERETVKLKKAEYMEQFIGCEYEGVISGVTGWGIYVELQNTVEGMVRAADLPGDYFVYDENTYEMVGRRTGKSYGLGESIRIKVKSVDKSTRTIDFEIPLDENGE